MKKWLFLSALAGAILLVAGCDCPPFTTDCGSVMDVESITVEDGGTKIKIVISPPPSTGTLRVRCHDFTDADTKIFPKDLDPVEYALDSTFLKTCKEHDVVYLFDGESGQIGISLRSIPIRYLSSPRGVVIDSKDTIVVAHDSSGYVLNSNGYVKFKPYAGEMFAPLPSGSYTDTMRVSGGDTVIVWIDHDRDGSAEYDEGDLFGVLMVGTDGMELRVMGNTSYEPLTGYRGLDLCFKCMSGR
ncbi:MAG: hypothetical protein GXO39_04190 [Thermotogae bacterium]|nr:hypothetical protein [Thermotogota bacterium]